MPGISAGWTLARYFSARFLLAIVAMFLVCCVLIFFVDLIEMLRRAGNYAGDIPGFLLAWITLLRLPSFSELVLPFAVLIGSIGIFLMLSRSSELVVLRAAGISVWQFTMPAIVVAFLLGIAFVLLYNPLAAVARGEAERLYGVAFGKDQSLLTSSKNAGAWLREDGTDGPTVIHAADVLNQGLELNGVSAFQYDRDHGLTERIEAKRAALKDGRWELEDAWVSAVGQEPEFYKRYLLSTYLTPTQVRDSLGTVFSISFWDLPNFIEIAERAGTSRHAISRAVPASPVAPLPARDHGLDRRHLLAQGLPLRQRSDQRHHRARLRFSDSSCSRKCRATSPWPD